VIKISHRETAQLSFMTAKGGINMKITKEVRGKYLATKFKRKERCKNGF